MSAVAVTLDNFSHHIDGDQRRVGASVAMASYDTGGSVFTANKFGLVRIDRALVESANGYVWEVDLANLKLKAYRQDGTTGALAEVPAATNVGTADMIVWGV